MNKVQFSLSVLVIVLILPFRLSAQQSLKPGENLIIEGIPEIPLSMVPAVKKYTESRSAGASGWHPVKNEMLIGTRFGNTNQIHLLRAPMGMRKQLSFFDEPANAIGFEPVNGEYFLFLRDQGGSEFSQIYRYDMKNGAISLLTEGGRGQNGGVGFNNKGDLIAFGSTRRNGGDRDIYIMNPKDSSSRKMIFQATGGGWGISDWSPDDKKIILFESISVNESHLWLLDVASGQKEELTPRNEEKTAYGTATFSADGKGIFFTSDAGNEFKRLAYKDLKSNKINYLTSDIKSDVGGFSMSDKRDQIIFITNDKGLSRVYHMDTHKKSYKELKGFPTGIIGGGEFHKDGNLVSFTIGSAKTSSDVYVYNLKEEKLERWTESEMGGLVADELQDASLITWKSFDGLEISGFYFKPALKFSGKRPVIINIHGGPEGQSLPGFQGRNNYYLNELGVAIIYPNVRGSTGYGKTFVALDNGKLRENSVQDIGALLDWIAKQPELDASRVMITGGSYGGYMTLACAIRYNDRIRCALDVVGISNFVTFLEKTEDYRRDLRRVEYGDERDPAMREFLQSISPTTNASKITKPLFIVQGTNDPRVPRGEAVQMVEVVRKNGSPVWYLEAKDEGHGFRKKNNADYQFYATLLFVQEFLLK